MASNDYLLHNRDNTDKPRIAQGGRIRLCSPANLIATGWMGGEFEANWEDATSKKAFAFSHWGSVMECQVTDHPTVPPQPLTPSQAPGDPNTVVGPNLWPLCGALSVSTNSTMQTVMQLDKENELNRLQMDRSTQMTGQQCVCELWSIHDSSVRRETEERISDRWIRAYTCRKDVHHALLISQHAQQAIMVHLLFK